MRRIERKIAIGHVYSACGAGDAQVGVVVKCTSGDRPGEEVLLMSESDASEFLQAFPIGSAVVLKDCIEVEAAPLPGEVKS